MHGDVIYLDANLRLNLQYARPCLQRNKIECLSWLCLDKNYQKGSGESANIISDFGKVNSRVEAISSLKGVARRVKSVPSFNVRKPREQEERNAMKRLITITKTAVWQKTYFFSPST